jgi:hypothetical protein
MEKSKLIKASICLLLFLSFQAKALQIDLEGSMQYQNTDFKQNNTSINMVGLGLRKIISDKKGDRLQLFLKTEAEDNFEEINLSQIYAKYKGPMGKWNLTLGRSLIPFGLITDFDSEFLILKTQEKKTVGFKTTDGLKLSGFWKNIDYEMLVSPGKWSEHSNKISEDKMIAFKLSHKGFDVEDWQFGVSFLTGEFADTDKSLASVDIIKFKGLLVSRNEFAIGKAEDEYLYSVFAGIDYSVLPAVDLNLAYTFFKTEFTENTALLGFSYNTPVYGFMLRAGNKYTFKDDTGEDKNEIFIQIYNRFSHFF